MLFSIVVPACNIAPYAPGMIDSIKAQTFSDFEAVIVNEESSDGSFPALEKAIGGDQRFKLIPKPRSGSASASRNYGIDHATGEYLVFLDGDDSLQPDALERFAGIIRTEHPDIIMSAIRCWNEQPDGTLVPKELWSLGRESEIFATGIDAMLARDNLEKNWIPGSGMNVFRTALLRDKQLYQAVGRMHQDDEWTYRVFMEAGKVVGSEYPYYNYRRNPNSITNTETLKSIRDRAANVTSVLTYWRTHNIPAKVRRPLANYYCKHFLHHSFFTRTVIGKLNPHRLTIAERRDMFRQCFGDAAQFAAYLSIARAAKMSERLMIPIMRLARLPGGFRTAELFFNFVYYPLIFVWWRELKKRLPFRKKAEGSRS